MLTSKNFVGGVRECIYQKHNQLDILINNALMTPCELREPTTVSELQFGVNFLGRFRINSRTFAPACGRAPVSRVVAVSGMAYLYGKIDFAIICVRSVLTLSVNITESKLANVLFSVELQRRIEAVGGHVISVAAQQAQIKPTCHAS